MPPIKLVVFDIAGTLIEDHDEVAQAFLRALTGNGIRVEPAEIQEWKGGSKRQVIRHFVERQFGQAGSNSELLEKTYCDFRQTLERSYAQPVTAVPGAADTLRELRAGKVAIATNTGFYREVRDAIMSRLGWTDWFDANVCSDDVPSGRPAPYMIFHAMEQTRVTDVSAVMAVGDTPLDLQAGANAGAGSIVGVLSGTHPESRLVRERHTHIIRSVAEIPELLKQLAIGA